MEIGSVVQTTANIAATVMHGFGSCTVELYQNEEISHYTDGTSTHRPVGAQYYVIVKLNSTTDCFCITFRFMQPTAICKTFAA